MNVPGAQCKCGLNHLNEFNYKLLALGHETFPILRYLPTWANETKRKALEFREMNRVNFASLINEVQTKMTTDSVPKWLVVENYVHWKPFYLSKISHWIATRK